jgi:hypothetical protein
MVLYRDALLMGLYTLTLAIMMLAAPLPLYRIDFVTNSSNGLTTSFFERCPINESDDGRVMSSQCQVFSPSDARCTGESDVSTLGKFCTVAACVFTGACVVLHFLIEHVAMPGYDYVVKGNAALSVFFAHLWWIASVAQYNTGLCDQPAASALPGGAIGANFGVALLAAFLSTGAFVVVLKRDLLADKKL